ncbi:porin [Piscinibacter sakaiensis]|uniref:Porin n=1 Tax=Piscinibacter sakaiensis TaxID=1547922 RepID=A0A0K8P1U2_PISS1|nr:porin [Piscinibacter sakaiensis]GAP36509.1 porin [Piscinibacter sakaiensis]
MKLQHLAAAAAALLAVGAASAQSNVTVYGLLDLGLQKSNGDARSATWRNGPADKAWNLAQSKGSRLGFRGSEELGGGLSAQFQIEHRFNPDTGAQNNATSFWSGRAFVQLTSKDFGAVYLGREYAPQYFVAVKTDPFGQDGVGQFSSRAYANFQSKGDNGARTNNTVGYKSPKLGGLSAQVAVSLGEGSTSRETGFNVEYASGPLYVAGAYARQDQGAVGTASNSGDGSTLVLLAAHYDFGVIKPVVQYSRSELGPTGNLKNDFWLVGATAPLGAAVLKAGYARFDPSGANNLQQKIAVGVDYFLSKRTKLYADLAVSKQKGTISGGNYGDYRAFAVGYQHNF